MNEKFRHDIATRIFFIDHIVSEWISSAMDLSCYLTPFTAQCRLVTTLRKKLSEIIMVISICTFYHNVFFPSGIKF